MFVAWYFFGDVSVTKSTPTPLPPQAFVVHVSFLPKPLFAYQLWSDRYLSFLGRRRRRTDVPGIPIMSLNSL